MKRRELLKASAAGSGLLGLGGLSVLTNGMWSKQASAQGLDRLYSQPNPAQPPVLPKDHGPHPDFRTEWWYFTGWFTSPNHPEPLGIQITFFRSAPQVDLRNPSAFNAKQLLIAHAAVAMPSEQKLRHQDIIRRAGTGSTQFQSDQNVLDLQLPNWHLVSKNGEQWRCSIQTAQLGLNLKIEATQAPWFQGQNGFSQKGPLPAQSSYYITQPHMAATGEIRLGSKRLQVSGQFWMDHEWSSTVLAPNAQGWDWVGLSGSQGQSLLAFQIRNQDPLKGPIWTHAALRQTNGQVKTFKSVHFETSKAWTSPRTGVTYPVEQVITLDGQRFYLQTLMDDQELDARASTGTLYWEGAVRAKTDLASHWGDGYLEMTGYDRPMQL
jgi:predicted secreted hydrolase